ncbi:MAG: hypothetical protein ISS01_01050 [Nanoarchaeota archaeon]|nr:hypothetical protein [Nanoarchaeota archaeon]
MKQLETTFKNIVMILCFIYFGISVLLFIFFLITFINDGQIFLFKRLMLQDAVLNVTKWIYGFLAITTAFGSITSFLAGIALMRSSQKVIVTEAVKETEKKVEEKHENKIDSDVLLPDEKKIIGILENHNGYMTQRDLVIESKFSKVKIHRLLKNLEAKKVISKYAFGMTNRIRLEKKIKE